MNKMTFKEIVNAIDKLDVSYQDIEIALNLDAEIDFDLTDEEFNSLCDYAKRVLDRTDVTECAIAQCIDDLLNEEDKTVKEILEMDVHDFADEASGWMDW